MIWIDSPAGLVTRRPKIEPAGQSPKKRSAQLRCDGAGEYILQDVFIYLYTFTYINMHIYIAYTYNVTY